MTINASDLLSGASSARSTTSVVTRTTTTDLAGLIVSRAANSGALTADTAKTMLNLSGASGLMSLCALKSVDTTIRTITLKVTCDGNVVYNAGLSTSAANFGHYACGVGGTSDTSGSLTAPSLPIRFQSTMLVEITSSLTETDKLVLYYDYVLEA